MSSGGNVYSCTLGFRPRVGFSIITSGTEDAGYSAGGCDLVFLGFFTFSVLIGISTLSMGVLEGDFDFRALAGFWSVSSETGFCKFGLSETPSGTSMLSVIFFALFDTLFSAFPVS